MDGGSVSGREGERKRRMGVTTLQHVRQLVSPPANYNQPPRLLILHLGRGDPQHVRKFNQSEEQKEREG